MTIFLPYLVLPFVALIAWAITAGGHLAYRFSEQVRLDALTLSLCHNRKNFIEDVIVNGNLEIQNLQNSMDSLARTCLASSLAGGALGILACPGIESALQIMSKTGIIIEKRQDFERLRYSSRWIKLQDYLKRENELLPEFGTLEAKDIPQFSALFDGFSREDLSNEQETFEAFFSIAWPKKLKPNLGFESLHSFQTAFFPHRLLIGTAENSKKFRGLKNFQHKSLQSKVTRSESQCWIRNSRGVFRVIRK